MAREERKRRLASEIERRDVTWEWMERIPVGFITGVVGQQGSGKSLFAARLAADLSGKRKRVILSAGENPEDLMTVPRLEMAEARKRLILTAGPRNHYILPRDLGVLETEVKKHRARIVIIDPLQAHLGGVSKHSDAVRMQVLRPLVDIAETYNCAIVIIDHDLRRVPAQAPLIRAVSQQLSQVAQLIYLIGVDPDDEERHLLLPIKHNIMMELKPLELTLTTGDEERSPDSALIGAREVDDLGFDPRMMLQSSTAKRGRPTEKLEAAQAWLMQYLYNAPGYTAKAKDIRVDGRKAEHSKKTLDRAAADCVTKNPPDGGDPNTTWTLTPEAVDEMAGGTGAADESGEAE